MIELIEATSAGRADGVVGVGVAGAGVAGFVSCAEVAVDSAAQMIAARIRIRSLSEDRNLDCMLVLLLQKVEAFPIKSRDQKNAKERYSRRVDVGCRYENESAFNMAFGSLRVEGSRRGARE